MIPISDGPKSPWSGGEVCVDGAQTGGMLRRLAEARTEAESVSMVGGAASVGSRMVISRVLDAGKDGRAERMGEVHGEMSSHLQMRPRGVESERGKAGTADCVHCTLEGKKAGNRNTQTLTSRPALASLVTRSKLESLSRTGEQFIHDWDIVRHRAAGASSRFGAGISLDDLDCLGSKVSRQCPSIQSRRWSRLRREVAQVSAWPDADGEVA
eukprot:3934723-Rhodomonas_salina.3